MSPRWTDSEGRVINMSDYVHQTERGTFVVATWSDRNAQWSAHMNASGARASGCHTVFARSLKGIDMDPCVTSYKTRSGAVRAAALAYGLTRSETVSS